MRPKHLIPATVLGIVLGLTPAAALATHLGAPAGTDGQAAARSETSDRELPREADGTPDEFLGQDGLMHAVTPIAVSGRHGYAYIGADFDTACAFGGLLEPGMKRLAALARVIARSGRRVVYTVTPNKSTVVRDGLPSPLPQGSCAQRGMNVQARILDRFRDPRYVPLRRRLIETPHAYWRLDSHWNTVGTSLMARSVAGGLDPELAARQHYRRTTRHHVGDLTEFVPGPDQEEAAALLPDNGVSTRPATGSPAYDPSLRHVYTDLSWVSRPAAKTYPGRTLVMGDSFTYVGFEAMSTLFRKGRFIWVGFVSAEELIKAIRKADTVVFTAVQRYVTINPLGAPEFLAILKDALRR